ncbi:hypothetical protein M569_12959 [Genlisea aurea]|uniref:Choline transporter-like protein 2 n=2 Tax=Magnoliopsida TaxID=3398 RepID=S8C551_9LAMI|nr:hypothetical protein M569_12959 [Genlisea aurea]
MGLRMMGSAREVEEYFSLCTVRWIGKKKRRTTASLSGNWTGVAEDEKRRLDDEIRVPSSGRRRRKSVSESDGELSSDYDDGSKSGKSEDGRDRSKTKGRTSKSGSKRRRSRQEDSRASSSEYSDSEDSSSCSEYSDSDSEEGRRRRRKEKRRREEKKEKRSKEKDKYRKRKDREEKKKREKKKKKMKKNEDKLKKGAVTGSWGMYGIIRETDMWNKRPEFTAWLAEIKKVALNLVSQYYNLDAYYQRKMEKDMKKGRGKVDKAERTVFDDEEQRRLELRRERERQKEEQVEALKRSMQSGMAQAMKEQAQLREEMAYQYKIGNLEAAAAIQRRLDPDVPILSSTAFLLTFPFNCSKEGVGGWRRRNMRGPPGRFSSGGTVNGSVDIIRHNRKCRDVAFLLVFIAFWIGMIVNSSFGFNKGDPMRLNYGLDYKGNVCGDRHAVPDLHELELRYWLNPNQVYQSDVKGTSFILSNARSICLLDCPIPSEDSLNWVCDYPEGDIKISIGEWIDRNYDYFADLTPELRNTSLQLQGPCYPVIFPSVNVYWTCQFIARASNVSMRHWEEMGGVKVIEDIAIDSAVHKAINSRSSVLKRYVADVGKAWPVLLVCGGLLPLFLSLLWLLMIRFLVGGMPWITVVLFNVLTVSVTMFYYLKAGWIGNDAISPIIGEHDPYYHVSARELSHLHVAAVIMTVVMIISFLSSIAILRRILMATSVLKASDFVAAKVIGEVRALIVFPVIPYGILVIFFMLWLSAALYLFSSGSVVQNDCGANCCAYDLKAKRLSCSSCCGFSVRYTSHVAAAVMFHLFGGYWAVQFIVACSSTVIAGSVASYYWARADASPEVPFLPVFASMRRLARYSLGSMAVGSLAVSFVESIRFMLEALRRRLKSVDSMPGTCLGEATYNTSQCVLRCIGFIVKSVNRNGYIMIAITGKGFFKASEIATELIVSNISRIGNVNVLGDVILFLGKLCVSLSSALFGFLMLDAHEYKSAHDKISSPLFPVMVCWGLGYVVASLFFGVVETSVDTIILSFCQDSEEHQGTARYAPPLLIQTLDDQSELRRLTQ